MARIQELDYSVNLLRAILWQYEDADVLQSLLKQKQAWYDRTQTKFWDDWYRDVFNLETCNDFGLAVWAIILDMPLYYGTRGSGPRGVWGFEEFNYNHTPIRPPLNIGYNFGRDADGAINLNTFQRRLVLKLRYYQITSKGTVPEINFVLNQVFGAFGRKAHVLDPLDMSTATFVFDFRPDKFTLEVLQKFDILPRPAGIGYTILIEPRNAFGFAPYYFNFGNSNFAGVKIQGEDGPTAFTDGYDLGYQ